jgi:threonine/homoserine/homoserine lactone efflux protein
MLTSMFLKGLVVGFVIAAPVGPVNVLCARRTIVYGRLVGIVSGLGAALADTFFGAVAAFGLVFIHTLLLTERFWLGLGGTVILVVIGIRTLTADVPRPKEGQEDAANLLGDFTSTFVLTLFNPVTILSFLACFSAFGIDSDERVSLDDWMLLLGVFTGATAWWLFLTTTVGMFRRKFNQETLRWANRIAGVIILAFAAVILWNVATVRL